MKTAAPKELSEYDEGRNPQLAKVAARLASLPGPDHVAKARVCDLCQASRFQHMHIVYICVAAALQMHARTCNGVDVGAITCCCHISQVSVRNCTRMAILVLGHSVTSTACLICVDRARHVLTILHVLCSAMCTMQGERRTSRRPRSTTRPGSYSSWASGSLAAATKRGCPGGCCGRGRTPCSVTVGSHQRHRRAIGMSQSGQGQPAVVTARSQQRHGTVTSTSGTCTSPVRRCGHDGDVRRAVVMRDASHINVALESTS